MDSICPKSIGSSTMPVVNSLCRFKLQRALIQAIVSRAYKAFYHHARPDKAQNTSKPGLTSHRIGDKEGMQQHNEAKKKSNSSQRNLCGDAFWLKLGEIQGRVSLICIPLGELRAMFRTFTFEGFDAMEDVAHDD